MTPDTEESEGSRVVGVQRRRDVDVDNDGKVEVVSNPKKFFVCPNCNQKKKSQVQSSDKTETGVSVVRPSKISDRVCKKCRKSSATTSEPLPAAPSEKKKRRSVVVFHPQWTHYCFLLAIYIVFSLILYFLTLKQQQQDAL